MRTGPVDQNVDSLKQLFALLNNVLRVPGEYITDSGLLNALKSQHGLAKYASTERGIAPSSLNTQKRLSSKVFEDGYAGLDRLRCKAGDRLRAAALFESKEKRKSRSVAGLSDTVAELKLKLSIARQDCWHLSTAFNRALSAGDSLAKSGDAAQLAKWSKTRRQLLSMITLTRGDPFGKDAPSEAGTDG